MRIISGTLGGRNFADASGGNTHPMGEKIRGALFNTLGDIKNLTVLDAYSGTGALAFEAVSRGARDVLAIELDKQAYAGIMSSVKVLGLGKNPKVIRANIATKARNLTRQFDIVLADPPYSDINRIVLRHLADRVQPGGLIIYSLPQAIDIGLDKKIFSLISSKNYGDATLQFFRRAS